MKKTRRGFTLVELLIVIVVIGILAAMMMLSSNEAVSSARASTVITNLRNLKTAALAMYNDNSDTYDAMSDVSGSPFAIDNKTHNVLKYLTGKGDIPDKGDYKLCMVADGSDHNGWYIMYNAGALKGTEGSRIRDKIKGRAAAVGLILMDANGTAPSGTTFTKYDGSASYVALQVR